jgi:TolA-binding protein
LVDETRRYERAEAALRDKRASVAIDELREYLTVYQHGSLRNEVRLTLLEALFADGRFSEARDLAKGLVGDLELRDRRAEIVRVLVRSRVRLGECEEAAADLARVPDAAPALTRDVAQCPARAAAQPASDGSHRIRE